MTERKELVIGFKPLDDLLSAKQSLFDYFGYVEDWTAIPIDDRREYFWKLIGEGCGGKVKYHEDPNELSEEKDEDGNFYRNEIYANRHLPKWVYRGENFTMICVDTRVDGNKFLAVYDNSKEIK